MPRRAADGRCARARPATVRTRASHEFARAIARSRSRNAGSLPSCARAASRALANSPAVAAMRTSGKAVHSGMGVVTTGLPPAKYSKSFSGDVLSVIGVDPEGDRRHVEQRAGSAAAPRTAAARSRPRWDGRGPAGRPGCRRGRVR